MSSSLLYCLICGNWTDGQLYCAGSCALEVRRLLDYGLARDRPGSQSLAGLINAYVAGGEAAILGLLGTADIAVAQWVARAAHCLGQNRNKY